MQYFLNGGRNERGIVKSRAALKLYQSLAIHKILIIPYAIMEDFWQQLWRDEQDLFGMPDFEVKALTALDTDIDYITKLINWADFIYLPGGAQKTLLRRMDQLGTNEILRRRLEKNDLKLLGGGSAGAMVMGDKCIVGRSEVEVVTEGLGLLPGFVIDSHFSQRNREPRLLQVLEQNSGLTGLGLDEDTGLVLDENLALQTVIGTGTVNVYSKTEKETYDSDSSF